MNVEGICMCNYTTNRITLVCPFQVIALGGRQDLGKMNIEVQTSLLQSRFVACVRA
jgi:hypothetical protein